MDPGGWYYLTAFFLGALHSLEPGHGKTVMTAYMVGHRVSVKQAALLGFSVTVAHTFSVLLLALVAQMISRRVSQDIAAPVLSFLGAGLVLVIGAWMWIRSPHHHDHVHIHGTDDGHAHSLKEMLTLGFSSGIVPCPEGVSLLLAAVAAGAMARGVNVIVVFSLGIGVVVMGAAILLSKIGGSVSKMVGRFESVARYMPRVSATIVTGLGVFLLVKALMDLRA